MTSYRKINKEIKMTGYYRIRENNIAGSKTLNTGKKFPHVKYIKQVMKDYKYRGE